MPTIVRVEVTDHGEPAGRQVRITTDCGHSFEWAGPAKDPPPMEGAASTFNCCRGRTENADGEVSNVRLPGSKPGYAYKRMRPPKDVARRSRVKVEPTFGSESSGPRRRRVAGDPLRVQPTPAEDPESAGRISL